MRPAMRVSCDGCVGGRRRRDNRLCERCRRERGICVTCGQAHTRGTYRCQECQAKNTLNKRASRSRTRRVVRPCTVCLGNHRSDACSLLPRETA